MSQRMGMADGRCFTVSTSSRLLNDYIMDQNGIDYTDNYTYRQFIQQKGPDVLNMLTKGQRIEECKAMCHEPLLKVPDTY